MSKNKANRKHGSSINVNDEDNKRGMLKKSGKTASFRKKSPKKESGQATVGSPLATSPLGPFNNNP